MALLRFLFISISILWLIRIIARLLMPFLFQQVVKKAQQQAGGQARNYESRKPEGTINVDYIPPQSKEPGPSDKAGDFIDYEEIK